MKKFLFVLLSLSFFAFQLGEKIPKDWFKAGSQPNKYEMGLDFKEFKDGKSSAFIQSSAVKIKGFGTLMQTSNVPANYLGKKVKMSGYLKTKNVEDWAGLWLRIDDKNGEKLSFDNMGQRPLKGTTDWTYCEIILNVPANSKSFNYGALLNGTGKIWFDSIKFEEAEGQVTGQIGLPLEKPSNTGFEE